MLVDKCSDSSAFQVFADDKLFLSDISNTIELHVHCDNDSETERVGSTLSTKHYEKHVRMYSLQLTGGILPTNLSLPAVSHTDNLTFFSFCVCRQ